LLLFPLEEEIALHMKNFESPLPISDLCQFWLRLAQWFWRRSEKCKCLTNRKNEGKIDNRQSEKLT
jgi:hypothetical protein